MLLRRVDWWRTEYADDVLRSYESKEADNARMAAAATTANERVLRKRFRSQSPQLHMRRCLVDWLATIVERLTLDNTTLHLAVHLLDYFMDNHDIEDHRLQLAALGCISVASKFEERDSKVPRLSELRNLSGNSYTLREFLQMELMLLKFFQWELCVPTAAHFAECYMDVVIADAVVDGNQAGADLDVHSYVAKYVKYFLDLSLQDHTFLRFRPSLVAAACLASTRLCLQVKPTWSTALLEKTKYNLSELLPCIDIMMRCHEADQIAARASTKRKNEENHGDCKRTGDGLNGDEDGTMEDAGSVVTSSPESDACSRYPESVISLWVKYTIFFFNFVIWVISLAMMAIGAWAFSEKYQMYGMVQVESAFDVFLDLAIILIILGGLVFFISFTGCIGALRENTCLLNLYSVILTLVFFAELALVIAAFVFPHRIVELTKEKLSYEVIEKYRDDENLQNLIDFMQMEFQCCGLSEEGYLDWNRNIYFNCSQHSASIERCSVPYSCCRDPTNIVNGLVNTMCGIGAQNMDYSKVVTLINTRSCIDSIKEYVNSNLHTFGSVVIGVIFAQMLVLHLSRKLLGQVEYHKLCYEREHRRPRLPYGPPSRL